MDGFSARDKYIQRITGAEQEAVMFSPSGKQEPAVCCHVLWLSHCRRTSLVASKISLANTLNLRVLAKFGY